MVIGISDHHVLDGQRNCSGGRHDRDGAKVAGVERPGQRIYYS